MINIIAVSIISAALYILLKKYSPEYCPVIEIASIILIVWTAYPYICDIIDFYNKFSSSSNLDNNYTKIILKVTGVALISQFASDICKDSGENALAVKIEFAGKTIIMSLAIPIIEALIQFATGLTK